MLTDRRNARARAAALTHVVSTLAERNGTAVSEEAIARAADLPRPAVARILRQLARRAMARRLDHERWRAAQFLVPAEHPALCLADEL